MIHLNTRTGFSFQRAYGTAKQVVARASQLGLKHLGIADYNSTWGHIPFQKECDKAGITPIFGLTLPVVATLDKDPRYDLVTLIAKKQDSLGHLYRAMQRARSQSYYRPRLTWNQVRGLRDEGLEVIVEYVRLENEDFPKSYGYPIALRPFANHMLGMAKQGEVEVIAAVGAAFPRIEDKEGFDIVRATSSLARIGEIEIEPFHMMADKEYRHALTTLNVPAALVERAFEATARVVDQASARIPKARNLTFEDTDARLVSLINEGIDARKKQTGIDYTSATYAARLDQEIAVIRAKNFIDYFIFVADLVRWAKGRMFVGPGRGSSGGSFICYLLGITEVDPIVHGTLFERFIDVTRNDWPDIDVDFPDRSRPEVLQHLIRTYGAEHVAKLGTVSEYQIKSALNDTARALKLPFSDARLVARIIGDDTTLEEAFNDKAIAGMVDQNPNFKKAALLEGQPRHSGVHAAGIVVAADPITNYASIDDESVAALTLKDAEDIGMLKMDALGLRTLTVIEDCCAHAGLDWEKLYTLPLDNPEVYDLFQRDMLTGIFQFEGSTVRGLTRAVKVDRFSDLCAITSLARPGPLEGGAAKNWVKRRNGEEETKFEHPALEPYLADTFGTIIYQEQMMNVVRHIGSFSIEDTNKFRRAIGKKLPEELKKFEAQFLENAGRLVGEATAKSLWHQMEESGSYAFNYSHAVAYSMVSYLTAYLKAHYPLEYGLANLLNAKDEEHSRALLQELFKDGTPVIPFDAERSDVNWSIQNGKLIGGFTILKGVGLKTAQKIVALRDAEPEHWRAKIGAGVMKKIEDTKSWEWADVGRLQRKLKTLYEAPDEFKTVNTPHGVGAGAIRIGDIPAGKGSYLFAGVCIRKMLRDKSDPEKVKQHGKVAGPQHYLSLILDDGTGEIGVTINRFKYADMGAAIWHDYRSEGKLFLVRGSCINEGSRWVMVDRIVDVDDWINGITENVDDEDIPF